MEHETTWLSRTEAAGWLKCSSDTISAYCQEMDEFGLDGVLRRDDGRLYRVNMKALSDYLFRRKTLKRGKP